MKFVELPSLKLPPGRLVVWRASAPPLSDARWEVDPRRASHDQEAHIVAIIDEVAAGRPMPPSWLGCTFDLPVEFDADAFAAALRGWIDQHEVLRSHLGFTTSDDVLRRRTLLPGTVSIRSSSAGPFTDSSELAQHLENLFDHEANPLDWPGYVFATIQHAEAVTVCLAADHSLMDGYSTLRVAHELHVLYAAGLTVADGEHPSPALSPAASYLDFAEAERAAAEALTSDAAFLDRWRQFLAEAGGRLPPFLLPVGDLTGCPVAQPGAYVDLLDAAAMHAFDQICRAAGGDTFAGLLACLAKVGQDTSRSGVFRTMAPFNTRTDRYRNSIGWYVGMGPIAFALNDADSFADVLQAAAIGLDGLKEMARTPMPRVAELLDVPLCDPFMVSYSDVRRTLGARHWQAWRTAILRARSTAPDDVYFWIVRDLAGLSVSYRHPATHAAGTAVPAYVTRVGHLLMSVAGSGEWPASPRLARELCL